VYRDAGKYANDVDEVFVVEDVDGGERNMGERD